MPFVKTFRQISKKDVKIAGGKGASLGEMTGAGLPVPPGFVVLEGGFENFLILAELNEKIKNILETVKAEDDKTVVKASAQIRSIISKTKIPQALEKDILEEFKKLNAKHVAVRSSATAEDSKSASWAGELETYLNVTKKDLLIQVIKCWSSLFTPRAIFYRLEKNLQKNKISVAVVIQKMVQSEVSGVCFTVHPVSKNRNQMVIEAGFGLGEAIVGGLITPDSYIIDKKRLSIVDVVVSQQRMMVIGKAQGTLNKKLSSNHGKKQKLSGRQIIELAKICKNIEKHYKQPQDIEWVYEKGKFYITQSRPITTL